MLIGSCVRQHSLHSFVTATSLPSPVTEVTTLSNGLTVLTEAHPSVQTAAAGVRIDTCGCAETDKTRGVHLLENIALKGTGKCFQHGLELKVENHGAHLNAYRSCAPL
jgi:mitochondrial-processing peptidase subunit beta